MSDRPTSSATPADPLTRESMLREEARVVLQLDGIDGDERAVLREINRAGATALCLSGGGIRSAAFALGIIQALAANPLRPATDGRTRRPVEHAEQSLLAQLHYLSTVSGGGYIGSWLSASVHRLGFERTHKALVEPGGDHPSEQHGHLVSWLRAYSNFITPKVGLFSGDTWTALALVLRNVLAIWLVLLPILVLVVGLVQMLELLLAWAWWGPVRAWMAAGLVTAGFFLHVRAAGFVTFSRYEIRRTGASMPNAPRPAMLVLRMAYLPLLGAFVLYVFAAAFALPRSGYGSYWDLGVFALSIPIACLGAGIGWCYGRFWLPGRIGRGAWGALRGASPPGSWHLPARDRTFGLGGLDCISWVAIAGLAFGTLITLGVVIGAWFIVPPLPRDGELPGLRFLMTPSITLVILGIPWLALSQLICEALFVAATNIVDTLRKPDDRVVDRREAEREWLGKFGGRLLVLALAWLAVTATVLLVPELVSYSASAPQASTLAGLSGAATLLAGWSRHSPATGAARERFGLSANVLLAIVAPIFAVLLLAGISEALHYVVEELGKPAPSVPAAAASDFHGADPFWWRLANLVIALHAAFLVLVLVHRLDINRFSLHSLYRNRLQRAFLGASRHAEGLQALERKRKPDGFTQLYSGDNLLVAQLAEPHPSDVGKRRRLFHVVNIGLNTLASSRFAWQERKAAPFTVTPLHAGSSLLRQTRPVADEAEVHVEELAEAVDRPCERTARSEELIGAFRPSREYGGAHGISLATAMAISGAAVSPNMGYHSSPGVTFLLALFNLRLGWWLGNPLRADAARLGGPTIAPLPYLYEAFGLTNERRKYVYLSDGGHFENLGLYEMVLRRCRYIIVSDAGCDGGLGFGDLGNAVRKIAIDHGIRISISPLEDASWSGSRPLRCAVGRIHYSEEDGDCEDGVLLYLKPWLHGDEPVGVASYGKANPAFPHETTADQWFSESQLESYRELGKHMMQRVIDDAVTREPAHRQGGPPTLAQLMARLGRRVGIR